MANLATDPHITIDYDAERGRYQVHHPITERDAVATYTEHVTYVEAQDTQGHVMKATGLPGRTTHRACIAAGL